MKIQTSINYGRYLKLMVELPRGNWYNVSLTFAKNKNNKNVDSKSLTQGIIPTYLKQTYRNHFHKTKRV